MKRLFDVLFSLLAIAFLSPLLLGSAIAVFLESGRPVFFRQVRVGMEGREFGMLKFRSMVQNAAVLGTYQTAVNDPRVTRVGRFLRRTSLDELPQLWNVLRGEMSLVGPRPFPAYHLEHFDEEFRRFRECVAPGMTGLWQVSSRAGDLEELDSYYIRNWSLWLDIDIAVRTVRAVWCGRGAC